MRESPPRVWDEAAAVPDIDAGMGACVLGGGRRFYLCKGSVVIGLDTLSATRKPIIMSVR